MARLSIADRGRIAGCTAGLLVAGLTTLNAQASTFILGVDFGAYNGSTNSPVQAGFVGYNLRTADTVGPFTNSFTGIDTTYSSNTITITLNNGTDLTTSSGNAMLARDNIASNTTLVNSGDFTYADLYRDVVKSKSSVMTIGISGLNANTQYSLTFYAYDTYQSRTMTFRDYTNGVAGTSVAVAWNKDYQFTSATPNTVYSGTFVVTADSSGQIIIRDTADSNQATLSALTLTPVAVPEPSTLGLGALVLGLICANRRNHT